MPRAAWGTARTHVWYPPRMSAAAALTLDQAHALLIADPALAPALSRVQALDFTALKRKLVADKGWTAETCAEVEDLYRKFLALTMLYPDRDICPTGPIDDFWHAHILDTWAYAQDCDLLFGRFLHHFPYFGLRGTQDREDLEQAFAATVDLFIRHYGIDPTAGDAQARSCRPQNCP